MEKKTVYNPTFAIMKGIAIISVVVGHCTLYKDVEAYVNQYHLAAFFFVAGYFLTEKYIEHPLDLLKKRLRSLYLPFVVSGIACVLLHNLLAKIYVYDNYLSFSEITTGIVNVMFKLFSSEPLMGAMWFCPTLLFTSIFAVFTIWVANKYNKVALTILFMIILIGIGEIALKVFHLKSPYSIWQNMIISGVLFEGWLYRNYLEKYFPSKNVYLLIIGISIALFLGMCVQQGYLFNLQAGHVKEVPAISLLFITFLASIMVYAFSKLIGNFRIGDIVAIVGNHSFSIMLFHFFAFKLVSLLLCICSGSPFTKISDFPTMQYNSIFWFVAYIVAGCFLPICIVKIKNIILKKS